MWVRKTSEENEKDIQQEAFRFSMKVSGFIFVINFIAAKAGWKYSLGTINPISWGDAISRLPKVFFWTGIAFFLFYFSQKAKERYARRKIFVCLSCDDSKETKDNRICECGEEKVDLNHAKWVDDSDLKGHSVI